jgi:hypothetical protein
MKSTAASTVTKIDVKPEWWDNIFAPSSCLVLITTALLVRADEVIE